jgi:hypothetical protein
MKVLLISVIPFLLILSQRLSAQMLEIIEDNAETLISGVHSNITHVNSIGIKSEGFGGITARRSNDPSSVGAVGISYGSDGFGVYGVCTGANGYAGYLIGGMGVFVVPRVGVNNVFPEHPLHVGTNSTNGNGAHVTIGGDWVNASSLSFKENFQSIDVRKILGSVCQMKIYRWRYKGSDEGSHIGPLAEDFFNAFKLGNDPRYISTVDADGVVLASIQALNEIREGQELMIEMLKKRIQLLEASNDQ